MIKILATALLLTTSISAQAAIINGGFETGNLDNWSSSGSVSASAGDSLVSPFDGSFSAKLTTQGTTAAGLASIMGISEATLEASNGGINATDGSLIYQSTYAEVGDSFTFNWNFVEKDYVPYDDWAFYGISLNGAAADITKFASLATVGPGGGTTVNGWESLTVNITATGNYTFYFGIVNALDTALDSDLWIDGFSGTGSLDPNAIPEPAPLALMGLGLVALSLSRKKKRNI